MKACDAFQVTETVGGRSVATLPVPRRGTALVGSVSLDFATQAASYSKRDYVFGGCTNQGAGDILWIDSSSLQAS